MGHLSGAQPVFGGPNSLANTTTYDLVPLNDQWCVQEADRDGQGFIKTLRLHGPYTKEAAEAMVVLLKHQNEGEER